MVKRAKGARLRRKRAKLQPVGMRPWAFSLGLHGALLLIITLLAGLSPKVEALSQPIELVDVLTDQPKGDSRSAMNDRATPKDAPHAVTPDTQPEARNVNERREVERPHPPRAPENPPPDLEALLAQREAQSRQREAARAGALASASEDPIRPDAGTHAQGPRGGVIDAGHGLTGDIGQRQILDKPPPSYPEAARRRGIEGDVRLRVWVSAEGGVARVEVVHLSGTPEMDQRAMEALRRWRFAPLPAGAPPTTQWGDVTLRFRLD